jgi:hypothetical protein
VRRWVRKRLRGSIGRDAILDLEQDLLLYLCSLPAKSKFRQKGTNGRPNGCGDVIECFDPVRHFGATAGRFHNFVSLCLANRLSTIHYGQRRSPLHHPNNVSICGSEPEAGSSQEAGEVSEEYLRKHASTLIQEYRKRERSEDILLRVFVNEFVSFAEERAPETLRVIDAIQSTATFLEAEKKAGMSSREFKKNREQLLILRESFLEKPRSRNAGRRL